eukprot:TRINITY_DN11182_c1_g1_i3.p1 TRINITY_DN11182_c1_g1~~TRINITY_DN11182_c1_g1_i3.p1  ORF type:complete len:525 (-),score=147.75 TRINITY_DN11182_c1_g1_i3:27-1601(-)
MKITAPTRVQSLVVPQLISEDAKDMLISSPTGSGKTLAYVLPILQRLLEESGEEDKDRHAVGTRVLIVVPTRELCVQIEEVLSNVAKKFYWIVCGSVMGGEKKKSEKARLRKGVTVLVSTPGRLLDHLKTTESFNLSNLRYLVFDEADRLMDMGFEASLTEIYDILSERVSDRFNADKVRAVLLSATLKPHVKGFASRVLRDPHYVSVHKEAVVDKDLSDVNIREEEAKEIALPETLQHGVVEVGYSRKFTALLGFLRWKMQTQEELKAIVFMTACAEVEYYHALLQEANVFPDADLHMLHGSLPQVDRTQIFLKFCSAKSGVLLCTNVAARGLDLPEIDWSIQYDAPEDVAEYVHRAGRTARKGRKGRGLLFLSPEKEIGFAKILEDHGIQLKKVELGPLVDLGFDLSNKCISVLVTDKEIEAKANAAFVAFVRGYSTYPRALKFIFHPKNLNLGKVAKSFLLRNAPSTIAKIFNRQRTAAPISMKEAVKIRNPEFAKGAMKQVHKGKKPLNTKFDALAEFMC